MSIVIVLCLVAQSCPTPCDLMNCSVPGSFAHGDSPGKNTGVGSLSLLQRIFRPRDETQVSSTAGRFFYHLSQNKTKKPIYCLQQRFSGFNSLENLSQRRWPSAVWTCPYKEDYQNQVSSAVLPMSMVWNGAFLSQTQRNLFFVTGPFSLTFSIAP